MKIKRILSLLLSLIMVLGMVTIPTYGEGNTINTYLTISKYGEIVKDKSGDTLAVAKVELSGKETYTLDDVFKAAHNTYFEGGAEAGYTSADSDWGLSITKFWGDESGNFGYQINGGSESVMGLSHVVEDGDYIDAYIMTANYEAYSNYDKYTAEVYVNENVDLTLNYVSGYDESNNYAPIVSACSDATITIDGVATETKTDANGKATVSFGEAGTYVVSANKTQTVNEEEVTAITAPVCVVMVKEYSDACITVPSNAELFVGSKGKTHFVSFTEVKPDTSVCDNEKNVTKYYFELTDGSTYNYRVSGNDYITYGGTFKKTADFNLEITEEQLKPANKTKSTIDRDAASNSGYNVADIYLNINPQGYLKLSKDQTYQIVNLRNWEAVNSTTANYFIEPDYNYAVIDENGNASSVVSIDENGLITAKNKGTAIVLVTYDAMNLDFGSGAGFFGAIWPENTGVFVVTVDGEDSGIETGITLNEGKNDSGIKLSGDALDAEHDCIYFVGEKGEYTFTPKTADCTVSVANPTVDTKMSYKGFATVTKNADGSFSIPLTTGRNIVKVEKDGNAEYQIITAKRVSVSINNGEAVHPGDTLSIKLDKLYHPANKLAGVYNMNAVTMYTSVSGYDGKLIGGGSAQYNFANSSTAQTISCTLKEKNAWGSISYQKDTELVVPEDYTYDTFRLADGFICVSGWGDSYGNHRAITYENGKGANLNAATKLAYLGKLPDIEIPVVVTDAALTSITLGTENVKTSYYEGDKFDAANLVVTANYEDGKTQLATNYTITPEVLTKDTEKVTVTYRGKTADIPVTVAELKVEAIEITKAPSKTTYKEGETFDPTGMVVTATYNNGAKKSTSNYSYAPNKELETNNTAMTITYTGDDAGEGLATVSVPITVTEKTSSGDTGETSDEIEVYFTLLGDSKHGEPTGSSDTHTKKAGNLKTWVSRTKVSVDKGSFVIDAVAKALSLKGIPYTNEDNYISEIKGLGEFDNGNLSGWMYTLNGEYPSLGVAEQKLSNGDAIVFHYTDDYTIEKTGYVSNDGSAGGAGSSNDEKEETKTDNTTVTEKDGKAEAVVSDKKIETELKELDSKEDKTVLIAPEISDTAKEVNVTLSVSTAEKIADKKAEVTVNTDVGIVTIENDTLTEITKQAKDKNVAIKIAKKEVSEISDKVSDKISDKSVAVDVKVSSGNKNITTFGGKSLEIHIPVSNIDYESGKKYVVIVISEDGSVEKTTGVCNKKSGKLVVTVETTHLSTFVVTPELAMEFTDVKGHWAESYIQQIAQKGLMNGVSDTKFAPDEDLTRAMFVTILYRMENEPKTSKAKFSDVAEGEWYTNAVAWANEEGIVSGVSETKFDPDANITREQMAAILYRYMEKKGLDTSAGEDTNILLYDDVINVSDYAVSAISWAVGSGIMKGETATTLNPANSATRAQVATILVRFFENISK